jgi:RimJ/RimL family protein N-acetyltransferase
LGSVDLTPAPTLRRATEADRDLLLAWANDPETRASSFHSQTIEPGEHAAWLARVLGSETDELLVGEIDGVPIGQVRLSRDELGVAEIGISVAPEARGRGLGSGLLQAAIEHGRTRSTPPVRTFRARVRIENAASRRLFEGAGFAVRREAMCDGQPCRIYERPA